MAKRLLKRVSKTAKQRRRLEKLLRARKRRDPNPSYDALEAKRLLALGVGSNDCAPDLVLSQVATQTVEVGQTLSFDIFSAGATVTDVDANGNPTGDNIRTLLDPDVPADTPEGASITEAGVFTWTPTQSQIGTFEIIVIAVDQGTPPLADAETFTVEVTASSGGNVAPVVDLNGASSGTGFASTFTEDAGAVSIVDTSVTVTDSDDTTLASASIVLSNRPDGDAESLSVDVGGTSISGNYDSTTGRLDLSGSDTLANYRQVISTLRYNNTSQDPDTTSREVTLTVNDGTDDSVASTATVTVEAVNDAPDLEAIPSQNATVGQLLEVTISATDPENDGLTFQFDPQATGIPASAAITANGNSASISWTPLASEGTGPFTFAVLVTDDSSSPLSDLETFTVSIATNAPIIDLNGNDSGSDFATTFTEDAGAVGLVAPDLLLSDPSDSNLVSATITITNLQDGPAELLSINDALATSITSVYLPETGVLTLTGSDSVANYQALLQSLEYNNASQDPNFANRVIEIVVSNGTEESTVRTSTVTIVTQNDSPNLLAISDQTATVGQEIVASVSATDVDSNDILTFALDPENQPADATIEQTPGARTATIRWTPTVDNTAAPVTFGVLVTDNGTPTLVDSETFEVVVSNNDDSDSPEVLSAPTGTFSSSFSSFPVSFNEAVGAEALNPSNYELVIIGGTNDGQTVPISSVISSGEQAVDIAFASELDEETYRLTLDATGISDVAGNLLTGTTTFDFTVAVPAALAVVAPQNGEQDVRTTRELRVTTSEPIDPSTINDDSFYVIAGGQKVAATIRVGSDNQSLTLFPNQPLPSSTRARLVIDGAAILGTDGLQLDGNGDGTPGGEGRFDFTTVGLTRIAGTSISGFVYDSTSSTDAEKVPIVGLTLRAEGVPGLTAVTDETGAFTLQDTPGNEFFVVLDASTAINAPEGYTYVGTSKPLHPVAGQATVLNKDGNPFDIFLPLAKDGDAITVTPGQITTAQFSESNLEMLADIRPDIARSEWEKLAIEIPPDSLFFEDGSSATQIQIFPLAADRIPAPVPDGLNPAIVFSLDAGGAESFDRPAKITYPNLDGLAPGEQRFIFSFDHDAGEWVPTGTMTVSHDASVLISNEGVQTVGWRIVSPDPLTEPEPPEHESCELDSVDNLKAILAAAGKELANLFKIGRQANAILDFLGAAEQLADSALNLAEEYRNGSLSIADVAREVTLVVGQKDELMNVWDTLTENNLVDKFAIVARSVLKAIEADIDRTLSLPDGCLNAYHRLLAELTDELLEGGQTLLDNIDKLSDTIRNSPFVAICLVVDEVVDKLEELQQSSAVNQLSQFDTAQLTTVDPFEIAIEELSVAMEDFVFRLDQPTTDFVGSLDATTERLGTLLDDAIVPMAVRADAIGSGYYSMHADALVIRGQYSDISALNLPTIPSNTNYVLELFSPDQSLVLRSEGVSGAAGQSFTISEFESIVLYEGVPDQDSDGLQDIVEEIVGTSALNADTDDDGVSDSAELNAGLNPLDGVVARPTGIISSVSFAGEARDVSVEGSASEVDGQTTFVASGSYGLGIIDSTDAVSASLLSELLLPGVTTDVAASRKLGIAALAAGINGLHLVDISNLLMPEMIESPSGLGTVNRVELVDGVIYAGGDQLTLFDATTRNELQQLNLGSPIRDIAFEGDRLFATTENNRLHVIEFSAGLAVSRGSLLLADRAASVFVDNNIAYVSNGSVTDLRGAPSGAALGEGGYTTVDVSDSENPILISGVDTPAVQSGNFKTITNGSGLALVAGGFRGLQLHDASDDSVTYDLIQEYQTPGFAQSVAIAGGMAFVADGSADLHIINYLPFDTAGVAPTIVSITTNPNDADDATPGFQVVEGSQFSITPIVTDDVQVRSVELVVDGQAVMEDISFPFDLATTLPTLASGSISITFQIRATDTGGNSTLTEPLDFEFEIIEDTAPPVVIQSTPFLNQTLFGTDSIRLVFDEAVDAAVFDLSGVELLFSGTLGVSEDISNRLESFNFIRGNRELILKFKEPQRVPGEYLLTVSKETIGDGFANLPDSDFILPFEIDDFAVVSALQGAPRVSHLPSANPGQLVEIRIENVSDETELRIDVIDRFGIVSQQSLFPVIVDPQGNSASYVIPANAVTGTVEVDSESGLLAPLQIVPVLDDARVLTVRETLDTNEVTIEFNGAGIVRSLTTEFVIGEEVILEDTVVGGISFPVLNESAVLTVPFTRGLSGRISITTEGGTSAPLEFGFDEIRSTALSGAPAITSNSSANAGQTVVITGERISLESSFVATFVAPDGDERLEVLRPLAVNQSGTEAMVRIPNSLNGLAEVFLLGSDSQHLLQIVPTIDSVNSDVLSSFEINGSGFVESNNSNYIFLGEPPLIDNSPSDDLLNVEDGATPNQVVRIETATPVSEEGLVVTTAGGSSRAFSSDYDLPPLEIRQLVTNSLQGTPATPSSPSANVGQVIEVIGEGLERGTEVEFLTRDLRGAFGTVSVQVLGASDDGKLAQVLVPDLATSGNVTVSGGGGSAYLQIVPVISSLGGFGRPGGNSDTVINGYDFQIFGSGFVEGASTVQIGGQTFEDFLLEDSWFDVDSDNTRVSIEAPLSVQSAITISTEGGSFTFPSSVADSAPLSQVRFAGIEERNLFGEGEAVAATVPAANAGQPILLVGAGFTSTTLVRFTAADDTGFSGFIERTGIPSEDGTTLAVTVPTLAKTGLVSVVGSSRSHLLQIVPYIRSIGGQVEPNEQLLISGSGFASGDLEVRVNGVVVEPTSVVSTFDSESFRVGDGPSLNRTIGFAQQIVEITVPDSIVGEAVVTVTTTGGTTTLVPAGSILESVNSVAEQGTPRRVDVSSANIGQTITLSGQGFQQGDRVLFVQEDKDGDVGTIVIEPTRITENEIDVEVPLSATTGAVRLEGEDQGILLQIVPMLIAAEQRTDIGRLIIEGSGFVDGGISVNLSNVSIDDPSPSRSIIDATSSRVFVSIPNEFQIGPVSVSTVGGTSNSVPITSGLSSSQLILIESNGGSDESNLENPTSTTRQHLTDEIFETDFQIELDPVSSEGLFLGR